MTKPSDWLKAQRHLFNLTQAEVAKGAGVSRAYVSLCESGAEGSIHKLTAFYLYLHRTTNPDLPVTTDHT